MEITHLCSCWQFSMKHVSRQGLRVNIPELYAICAEDIHECVLVFKEKPGLCKSWDGKRHIWIVKDWHKEWWNMFPLQDIWGVCHYGAYQWNETENICLH
jgi:hypothetical protein